MIYQDRIHFYKSLPNIISVEIDLGYPVYLSETKDYTSFNLALLSRENGRWFMYSAPPLKRTHQEVVRNRSSITSTEENNDNAKMIEYYPPLEIDNVLSKVATMDGTIIQHEAVLKQQGFIIFIESTEELIDRITQLLNNMSITNKVSIERTKVQDVENPIPQCIEFLKENGDYNNLEIIKTVWKMRKRELKNNVAGVFQNKGTFRPKFFDNLSANIIGTIENDEVKGNSQYIKLCESSDKYTIEFYVLSYWFGDFFRNVIKMYMGPFYYWSYSNGKGELENYFIINRSLKKEFLYGLLQHWKEPKRSKHYNYIEYIEKLKKLL